MVNKFVCPLSILILILGLNLSSCGGDDGDNQGISHQGIHEGSLEHFRRKIDDPNSFPGGLDLGQSQGGCFCYTNSSGVKFSRYIPHDPNLAGSGVFIDTNTRHAARQGKTIGSQHSRLRKLDDEVQEFLPLGGTSAFATPGCPSGQYYSHQEGGCRAMPVNVERGATFRHNNDRWYTIDFQYPIWANPVKEERQDGENSRRPIYQLTGQCSGGYGQGGQGC